MKFERVKLAEIFRENNKLIIDFEEQDANIFQIIGFLRVTIRAYENELVKGFFDEEK